jgi:hypothetical protein
MGGGMMPDYSRAKFVTADKLLGGKIGGKTERTINGHILHSIRKESWKLALVECRRCGLRARPGNEKKFEKTRCK